MDSLTVRLTRDGRGWVAEVEEIPGAISQGRTPASALVNLADAIRLLEADQRSSPPSEGPAPARTGRLR